jgi:hypothetical protein
MPQRRLSPLTSVRSAEQAQQRLHAAAPPRAQRRVGPQLFICTRRRQNCHRCCCTYARLRAPRKEDRRLARQEICQRQQEALLKAVGVDQRCQENDRGLPQKMIRASSPAFLLMALVTWLQILCPGATRAAAGGAPAAVCRSGSVPPGCALISDTSHRRARSARSGRETTVQRCVVVRTGRCDSKACDGNSEASIMLLVTTFTYLFCISYVSCVFIDLLRRDSNFPFGLP